MHTPSVCVVPASKPLPSGQIVIECATHAPLSSKALKRPLLQVVHLLSFDAEPGEKLSPRSQVATECPVQSPAPLAEYVPVVHASVRLRMVPILIDTVMERPVAAVRPIDAFVAIASEMDDPDWRSAMALLASSALTLMTTPMSSNLLSSARRRRRRVPSIIS